MTAPLLHVGALVVRQSVFGDWLVDDGGIVPIRTTTSERAFEEAAARSLNSPPVGDPSSVGESPAVRPQITTAGVAGFDPDGLPPATVGTVPESATGASPGAPGSGTASSSSTSRSGTSRAEGVVGAAVEVPSPPREALGVSR